jgi:GNAT superfamily N-acetyltransferase
MTGAVHIRSAIHDDAMGIATVHVQSWRETYSGLMPESVIHRQSVESRLAMWQHILADGRAVVCVAEEETEGIVGFASGGAARGLTDQFDGEIYAIYLLRSHQKRGIGRALIETIAARLYEAGFHSLMLWVLASNETRRFYAHMGGVPIAEKQEIIGEATLSEIAFGWLEITEMGAGDR